LFAFIGMSRRKTKNLDPETGLRRSRMRHSLFSPALEQPHVTAQLRPKDLRSRRALRQLSSCVWHQAAGLQDLQRRGHL